jgi:membrane fusion protein, heavy metal efflux system
MLGRIGFLGGAFLVGLAVAVLVPGLPQSMRKAIGLDGPTKPVHGASTADSRDADKKPAADSGIVKLTPDQISAAAIDVAAVGQGAVARRIVVPGTVMLHADRIARISVKLSATVAELRKKIGDTVAKDEVLAVLESREVADAKSDYLAARLTSELQQDLFERDKALYGKGVASEQQFIRSRNQAAQAKMKFDIARQKLIALGVDDQEIAGLPTQPEGLLKRQEVRSPIAGRVVERKVDLGTAVGRDNLETELFVVADLDRVWVDLAMSPTDLPALKEGQALVIASRSVPQKAEGRVIFISPLLDKETRTARVVAEIDNADGRWRPGSFVSATIATDEQTVPIIVPTAAVQTVAGEKVVFVRTAEGFQKRAIVTGRSDEGWTEVTGGLQPGETVAASNTFLLKSELMKGAGED